MCKIKKYILLLFASSFCKTHYILKLILGVKENLYNNRAVATITAYKNGSKTQCARVVGSTLNDVRITTLTLVKILLNIISINDKELDHRVGLKSRFLVGIKWKSILNMFIKLKKL